MVATMTDNATTARQCVCMNGEMRAVCSSTTDLEPICPPRVCPSAPPAVEPIQRSRGSPLGTSACYQKQVYIERTRSYEWRDICR